MLRRFSSKLTGKGKNDDSNGHANGGNHGVKADQPDGARRHSSFVPQKKPKETVDHAMSRGEVESSFQRFAQLIHASRRPLPTQSGDGAYLDHAEPSGLMQDLKSIGFKDVNTLMQVMKQKKSGTFQDDKTYIMERVIQVSLMVLLAAMGANRAMKLVSGLPSLSKTRVDLTNAFIDELWNSLQHPPMSYLGDKFTYRQADGGNNVSRFHQ